jgi:hypothetical protein
MQPVPIATDVVSSNLDQGESELLTTPLKRIKLATLVWFFYWFYGV